MKDERMIGKRLDRARATKSERDQTSSEREPRDAATLILIDRSGPVPKVLLGTPPCAAINFMPGKFVFPGGRVEPGDRQMPIAAHLDARDRRAPDARVQRPSLAKARALALAAIRETYEETGLMLGEARDDAAAGAGRPWEAFAKAQRPARSRAAAFHRPRHHAAAAARAASMPLFRRRCERGRAQRRGLCRRRTANWSNWSGCRSPTRKPARHAGHHRSRRSKSCRPASPSRLGPRPAGAVLSHAAQEIRAANSFEVQSVCSRFP